MKSLPIGISDYKEIITKDYYFVDKTLLIQELLDIKYKVYLLCRPRRFGKTLNLSMLKYFFEKTDKSNAHLFASKKIWQNEESRNEQGKYPVIFISFKDIKDDNWESAYQHILDLIMIEFEYHEQFLLPKLTARQAKKYSMIADGQASQVTYTSSLLFLSEILFAHYGQEVVVLLDEYDTPIHTAYKHNYYDKMVSFIKTLFSKVLKDNKRLKSGVLTGILRTAKEGIFSDLNNLYVCTMLSDKFSDKFGFTSDEVDLLLEDQDLVNKKPAIKEWYNGYRAGEKTLLYNPWSILNCASGRGDLKTYWANTSSNALIKDLIASADSITKTELELLLTDTPITKTIDEAFTFAGINQMGSSLWSLLLFSGYLTFNKRTVTDDGEYSCSLILPNHEIKALYKKLINQIFMQAIEKFDHAQELFNALIIGNVYRIQQLLQQFIINHVSIFDLAYSQPEISYHMFVLGLLVTLEGEYQVRSNRESGYGRYDIMLIPIDKSKTGVVIEFKKTENETLEQAANAGLLKIQYKQYAQELRAQGIKDIMGYGIAFAGKELLVKNITL